jgi:hypothetical protein
VFLSVGGTVGDLRSFTFNSSGTRLYCVGDNNIIYQFNLSTPWDLSTAAYATLTFDAGTALGFTGPDALISLVNNNTRLLISRGSTSPDSLIYQCTLATASQINTAAYDSISHDLSAQTTSGGTPQGLFVQANGQHFYMIAGNSTNRTSQYNMGTPFSGSVPVVAEFIK